MPAPLSVAIDIADITLTDPHGGDVPLSELTGVSVLVLMRHRH